MDKEEYYTESTAALLAEAIGRYSAYSYCMWQLASLDMADQSIRTSNAYIKIKERIEARCHEAADDWQALAAAYDPTVVTYDNNKEAEGLV